MPNRKKINPAEMYGITRSKRKNGESLCWRVTICRRGTSIHEVFPDQTWDGAENALAAAKRYRDAAVQLIPPLTMREYMQTVKTNNTSGLVGVQSKREPSGVVRWIAQAKLPGGKYVSKSFAESVYGSRARELAIQARQEMLNLVDETSTFTFSPGAIAETIPAEFPAALPRPPRVLLMQVALDAVTQFGGEEVAQIFVRDYMEKYKRLPKKGISARIRFVSAEDSKKQDIAKA